MKPTDIEHLVSVGAPTISPDGRFAVVGISRPDLGSNEYRGNLWLVVLDGSTEPRQLTFGEHDRAPRLSPDGRWLAFLRSDPEATGARAKPQLYLIAVAGGDARRLTDLPGGAGEAVWSPDSRSIAFVARVPEPGRYGQDEDVPPGKEPPRRITGLQYRLDDVGFVIDQRHQVFLLDQVLSEDAAAPRRLTEGDGENRDVTWSPSGEWLAFVSSRHERREHDRVSDVFVVRHDGSQLRQVTDSSLEIDRPTFTPSGDTLVMLASDPGPERDQWVGRQVGVFAVDVVPGGRPHRLTDDETYQVIDTELVVDEHRVLAVYEHRGANDLISVPLDGSGPTTISDGPRMITGFASAGETIAVSYTDETSAGELGVVGDGDVHPLTDFARRFRDHADPLRMIELTPSAPDGQQLHGFLVLPDGDGPFPVLLMIHGGPFTQYGWKLFDEAQVYAGAGYAVVYTNPRGSSGYGAAYGAYVKHDVGARSAVDLLAMLDDALTRPELDEHRVGVLGGSHGGYMTSWLVGHETDRFRAAVSERAVNAIDSFTGSSDIGWGFRNDLYGPGAEAQQRQSPLSYADAITTPLLIIHSEQDWRCPIEQAQRLYVALRDRDATVEMLIFPGEGHELSRSGLPSHRLARFDAILQWFGQHLR